MKSRPMTRTRSLTVSALLLAGVGGCMVGPNYKRPATPTPPAYKEAEGWAPAQPSDAADRKDWWKVFGDPTLDDLEAKVETSNQTLAAAEAAYREAHALVAQDRAALFPTVSLGANVTQSGGGSGSQQTSSGVGGGSHTHTIYEPTLGGTWAPDLWGAVRRQINNAKASAQASAALVANARLSAQTELADDYISLRALDEEKRLYDTTVAAYARTLEITKNKYAVGNAAKSDVLTAQTQLESAQVTDADLARQRALMEHAIAILIGQPPASLTLASASWNLNLPEIPAALPSTLLQRRPDVANAERSAAAANELIGVAVAAYYPTLSLSAEGGFASNTLSNLFNASNSFWSLGASLSETIFDAGARHAKVQGARAAFDEAVANYRQTVLTAFGQVEDNLAAQRIYGTEEPLAKAASDDANTNVTITTNEYRAGTVDFTTVVTAQATALQDQNTLVQLQASRLATAVALIEALGGGWTTTDLPKS
jgi:NodT family efflux transporter outer membrane factor (OMF) lipoprotein